MGITFSQVPEPFGTVHFCLLAVVLLSCVLAFCILEKLSNDKLIRVIFITGLCMIVAEVFKQWFLLRFTDEGGFLSWSFPFQLCSMSMYCAVMLPFLRNRIRDAVLVFLTTYSLLAALAALLYPADMMRPQIVLFCHSFLYHAAMLWVSIASLLVLRHERKKPFYPALLLFTGMAFMAECINILSHYLVGDPSREANMFYITPYSPSPQPVFSAIAESWGVLPEILIYLFAISLACFGVYRIERHFMHSGSASDLP